MFYIEPEVEGGEAQPFMDFVNSLTLPPESEPGRRLTEQEFYEKLDAEEGNQEALDSIRDDIIKGHHYLKAADVRRIGRPALEYIKANGEVGLVRQLILCRPIRPGHGRSMQDERLAR